MLAGTEDVVLAGLERLFKLESDCELIARCEDIERIAFVAVACQPDLLVMHVPRPSDGKAEALLREIKAAAIPTHIVFVPGALARCIRRAHAEGTKESFREQRGDEVRSTQSEARVGG